MLTPNVCACLNFRSAYMHNFLGGGHTKILDPNVSWGLWRACNLYYYYSSYLFPFALKNRYSIIYSDDLNRHRGWYCILRNKTER
jgi:hypothetical protein